MLLKEYLEKEKSGEERLISSIANILKREGKLVSKEIIKNELKKIEADKEFMEETKKRAKESSNENAYLYFVIRKRAVNALK